LNLSIHLQWQHQLEAALSLTVGLLLQAFALEILLQHVFLTIPEQSLRIAMAERIRWAVLEVTLCLSCAVQSP
jgi:uncharacterized membrane protein YczE